MCPLPKLPWGQVGVGCLDIVVERCPARMVRVFSKKCSQDFFSQKSEVLERSGSVVECLTRDRSAGGSSFTGFTALCP